LALLFGHLSLPVVCDVSWWELVGLKGTTVIFDPQLQLRHLQLINQFTSAFWMVPTGEVTHSPLAQTKTILTTRDNYLFFAEKLY